MNEREISSGELRRIQFGPRDEAPAFIVRVSFTSDDPWGVVHRAGDVLARVLEQVQSWPSDRAWSDLLPSWFVERCASEPEPGDRADEWLLQWQAMTEAEKAEAAEGPWTLLDWLYYFDPIEGLGNDRSWWWWNAGSDEPHKGWIEVATTGLPFGEGSLYWLIEACGGEDPDY
ncbi:hypothetical protein ACBJ59_54925 [Nonomuraea sp. MTCD27]|uniref:hypothetical protein n=1 Tax=Nonomuraea sp. MTCD27 TaxID=1676747 RepID=UPI0035BEC356